jgi:hypothetical protein
LDYLRSAKAGMIAGLAFGFITALLSVMSASSVQALLFAFVLFPAIRMIYGIIFGIVFGAVADRFMSGRSYLLRGVVFGLVLGAAEVALNLFALSEGVSGLIENLIVGITSSLIFGCVLGYSYGRMVR